MLRILPFGCTVLGQVYVYFTLPYTRDNYKRICNYTRPVGGDKQYAQYWNQNQSFTLQKLPLLFVVAQLFQLAYFEERKLMIIRVMQKLWGQFAFICLMLYEKSKVTYLFEARLL